jgi:hypothetical protein
MKKILFILVSFPVIAFASRDTIIASGKWNAGTTWADGTAPGSTDTVYKINNGTFNDTLDANYTIVAFICNASTDGTHWRNGRTLTVTGSGNAYVDDGTGTRDLGTGLTFSGASATAHFGSTLGAVTASSCALTMNGTTAMVIDDDKGVTFKSLTLGTNAVVTNSGGSTTFYISDGESPLTIVNGGTLTVNRAMDFRLTQNGNFTNIIGSPTINGTAGITFRAATTNGISVNMPALNTSGAGLNIFISIGSTLNLTGNISTNAILLGNASAVTFTFNSNNYSITGTSFAWGGNAVGSTSIFNFGSSVINVTSVASTYNTGTINTNLQTSTWTCTGNWTFGSNHTINPGTSIVTLNGTGAQTVTSNGKSFHDLTVNNTGTAFVSLADSLTTNDITMTDGPFNTATYGISAVDMVHSTTDSVRFQNLWLTGDYTRGALATKSDTAGQHIRFSAGASHTMAAANKVYARVTTSGPLTITEGATIATLSYGVDGIPVTIATGTTLTAGTVSIGGTAGALDTLQGSGGSAGLSFAGGDIRDTASYIYVANIALAAGDTLDLRDGTSIDGGGNTGAILWPSSGTGSVVIDRKIKTKVGVKTKVGFYREDYSEITNWKDMY